ncbi:hypothetical protein DC882_24525 [Vibrio parahaemolyticus]|nr:hypothetical protein [Vibrio parahaemolyticus]
MFHQSFLKTKNKNKIKKGLEMIELVKQNNKVFVKIGSKQEVHWREQGFKEPKVSAKKAVKNEQSES